MRFNLIMLDDAAKPWWQGLDGNAAGTIVWVLETR